jgi:FtsP/CotA-like multicopper oxidase with cupredoxin domain
VANSLVPTARAGESANSAQPEPVKSAGYDKGDSAKQFPPGEPGKDYAPVITPNGSTLPYKIVDGVKVFHLIPGEVDHEFAPGLRAHCWGFNGQVHGPTIEAVEGDRLRIYHDCKGS